MLGPAVLLCGGPTVWRLTGLGAEGVPSSPSVMEEEAGLHPRRHALSFSSHAHDTPLLFPFGILVPAVCRD